MGATLDTLEWLILILSQAFGIGCELARMVDNWGKCKFILFHQYSMVCGKETILKYLQATGKPS